MSDPNDSQDIPPPSKRDADRALIRYRMDQCESRLNEGAKAFANLRAEGDRLIRRAGLAIIAGIFGALTAVASAAYSIGTRNAQVSSMEKAIGELVIQRQKQEEERVELIRRIDSLRSELDSEHDARLDLQEQIKALQMQVKPKWNR